MKLIAVLLTLLLFVCFPSSATAQSSPIALVQHTSKDAGTVTSAALAFKSNNTAGNWIGVCIRTGTSGQLFSVTDSNRNVYKRAVQFNVTIDGPNGDTLGIYYAENIAAGANTVTVSDTISATMRFAIVEYSGIAAANSLDVIAAAQGTGTSANSGNVLTTQNGDLLLGAIMTGNPTNYSAGSGYTIRESVPAEPSSKLIAEDQVQATAGAVSAGGSLGAANNWGAGLAAFKAAAGINPLPNITSLSPASGAVGTVVTITGTNFGAALGTVSFNGTAGTPTSWSTTSIVVPVPSGATTGNVIITDPGIPSNGVAFTVTTPAPSITSLNPSSGVVGTPVTITGVNFGTSQGTSTVSFNGTKATPTSWSATSITVPVPAGVTTGNLLVTTSGIASNAMAFTLVSTSPIALVQHANKDAGTVTSATLAFNSNNTAGNWIGVCIRAGTSGQLFAVTDSNRNVYKRAVQYNVTIDPPNGDTLGIYYAENIAGGANTITVSDTFSATLRFAIVEYSGIAPANSLDVIAAAQGTSTSPNSGNALTTQNGDLLLGAFMTGNPTAYTAGSGYAIRESVPAAPNAKLIAEDQIQATAGSASASASLGASNNWGAGLAAFKAASGGAATSPNIASLTPTSGSVGMSVTLAGAGFGATQGTSTVKFNGTTATPTSWNTASIAVKVPAGAATGNVVVTVGGVASNGVSFTVQANTAPPVVALTAPANNASVSGTITLIATATDPDSPVSFVQFLVDGTNTGAQLTASPYSTSLDATTLSNGNHTLTAVAQDPSANVGTSAVVTITVSNTTNTSMGPLKQSSVNTRYFVNPAGNAVFLSGSHTWDDFQDTDTNVGSTPAAVDFNAYVNFLKAHGQNATILWKRDVPEYCGWNVSGSTWRIGPWPWLRTGPGVATDGNPKFDLTQFNQAYFDRLRARALQLQQNGIYAIVQLFDGNQLTSYRCGTDGYELTGTNNVNGVDDGYKSGTCGVGSVTMTTNNAITNVQDAYVKKVIDTLNDLPNVMWEVAEEQPGTSFSGCQGYGGASSMTFWAPHLFGLIKTYEAGGTWEGTTYSAKPFQHPAGIGSMNYGDRTGGDAKLYASTATWVAPSINSGVDQFPSNVPTNNQGKVLINDSDHSLGFKGFLNADGSMQDQNLRGYLWENITLGAEALLLMDPYVIYWQGSPVRNTCLNPANQVCTGVDTKYDKFRSSMGLAQAFVNAKMDLVKATPQGSLSSTGFCLADNVATGAEYLVYAPSGGTFTVNLGATTRALNVEWFNPATGATATGAAIAGGSTKSFTAPFSGDAVLYIVDASGHN